MNLITITMIMNTTISVSVEVRDKIKEFGDRGDSYSDILEKLYKSAKERQLHDLLFDEKDTVNIREAIASARKRWQK